MSRPDDIRLSFNEAAETYDRVRPGYPAALFEALFEMLPASPEIVEVGPGTGKATKDLLARAASIHAIEIGPAMAAKLRENLPSDRLLITVGDFETLSIEPGSADAVFSASAYHWITPRAQTDRPAFILRHGGVVAIVDLIQVDSPVDKGFFTAAQPVYERYGEAHKGPPAPARDTADPPLRLALEADPRFDRVAVRRYDWNQTYSASDYRLDAMESLIRKEFGGEITRPLVVTLTTAVLT